MISFFFFNASNDRKFRKDFLYFYIALYVKYLRKSIITDFSFSHSQHVKIKSR